SRVGDFNRLSAFEAGPAPGPRPVVAARLPGLRGRTGRHPLGLLLWLRLNLRTLWRRDLRALRRDDARRLRHLVARDRVREGLLRLLRVRTHDLGLLQPFRTLRASRWLPATPVGRRLSLR